MKSRVFLIVAILSNKNSSLVNRSLRARNYSNVTSVLNNKKRGERREISKKRIVLRLTLYEGLLAVFIDREASLTEEGNVLDDSL